MSKRGKMKARMRDLLLFIPNLLILLFKLLRDPRVSSADKAILAATIIYVIAPIDVIPDFIPFIGQVDDAYLIAISMLRLLNRADRTVVMEHWKGERDIKELVTNIARVAEYFLPKRLKNVLRGRIEPRVKIEERRSLPRAVNE
ncbi:MAG TPA: YkvA family protein [Blastocatellia bacterium]|nr:YkvA family protein [Blastocatellia bacterium]